MSGTELLGTAIGATMLGLGAASVLASTLHRRAGDRTLMLFGAWCGLYGARLMAEQALIVETLGVPAVAAQYFRAYVTYAINVPVGLFVASVIGEGWKKSVRRVWQVQAIYAVAAIAGDTILREPRAMMFLNSPIVFTGILVAAANLLFYRDRISPIFRSRVMGLGAAVLVLFVANENLRRSFVTAVYGVIDIEAGELTVANAGHPSLLVGAASGRVEECQERGAMLGLMPEALYRNQHRRIEPGDRILLYTDGVTEAQNPAGEFLDGERLASRLAASIEGSAPAVAQRILSQLQRWRGAASFDDDVTFVLARVSGVAQPHRGSRPSTIS